MSKIIRLPILKQPNQGSLQAIYMHRNFSEETKCHLLCFGFEEYENNVLARKLPEMTHEQCQKALDASSRPLAEVTEPVTLNGIDELLEWLDDE